jgi:Protein of unknown function (DUF1360)
MLELLITVIIAGLVVYRVTRFVILDSMIEGTRDWIEGKLIGDKPNLIRDKLDDLFHCPYCLSVWISAATIAVADRYRSVPLPVFAWLATAAACMVVWTIVEDDDEEE